MFAYEVWATILTVSIAFVVLYPEDAANFLKLLTLAPSLIRLWLAQRLFMLKIGPRLAIEKFLFNRRLNQLRRQYNLTESTDRETNE